MRDVGLLLEHLSFTERMMKRSGLLLVLIFIGITLSSVAAQTVDRAIEFLRTACAAGQRLDIRVEGDGGISLFKKGVAGKLHFSKEDARGVVESLSGQLQHDNLQDQRECMRPYITRILDAILPGSPPPSGPAVPTPDPLTPTETAIDKTLVPQSTLTFRFRQSTINGVFYTNALVMSVHRPRWVEINAGRSRSHFLGELGVPDDQESGSAYQVDVSFDNAAPVLSTAVRFGETKRLNLDVTNVLRIRISISPIARSRGYLAIGNPRFR